MILDSTVPLPPERRAEVAEELNARLADTLALAFAAKFAHWNVNGPAFGDLHKAFDKLAATLYGSADAFAERAAQLGVPAVGTLEQVAARVIDAKVLVPYPIATAAGRDHVRELVTRLDAYARALTESRARVAKSDMTTYDLFTRTLAAIDDHGWRLHRMLATEA